MAETQLGDSGAGDKPALGAPGEVGAARLEAAAMLARNVAHDINNLMGTILGHSSVAKQMAGAEMEKTVAAIEEAAEKASHLAQRLFTFIQGTNRPPEVLNLNAIVYHALQYEEQELAPKLRIKRYIDPDLWNVAAEPNQINQVILSLCINALNAVGQEGLITLTTKNVVLDDDSTRALRGLKPGPHIILSVEDSGQGFSSDELAHIFESSQTSHDKRPSLALVYRMVKDHRGHIAVRSEPDIGTTFDVYLPATDAAVGTKVALEGEVPRGYETILVVDDDVTILNVTRTVLESMGYHVLLAHNGREAINVAKTYEGAIHLALLDMAMPEMGGAETYPLLMKARPQIKIIVMSGFDLGALSKSLRDAGVSGLLQKPFRRDHLAKTVREALDRRNVA